MGTDDFFERVIGLVGLKAAGKDEFGRRLASHYGFTHTRISDAIRAEAAKLGLANPATAELQDIGNRGRQISGDGGYWPKELLKLMREQDHRRVAVNGIRHPDEAIALKEICGEKFVLVGIVAPTLIRAARFMSRGQAGDPKEFERFLMIDDRDRGIGEPSYGQQVDRTLALARWENIYNNNGSLEEYRTWISSFMDKNLPKADCDK
ncbi:hypothetical protein HYT45_04445 [Candidatus Uhrbacteria bacterium]|nr:hypothetical protein [Candidatus Uhrbacteria bacterium]